MSRSPINIIEADQTWADQSREFCREAYETSYTRPDIGITADLFSTQVFSSDRIRRYYQDLCTPTESHQAWIALDDSQQLLGMVAATLSMNHCEMKSLYVKNKGQGLGKQLFNKVLEFAADKPVNLDVIWYMADTIAIYEHWGFQPVPDAEPVYYPLQEWPEAARRTYYGVCMVRPVA